MEPLKRGEEGTWSHPEVNRQIFHFLKRKAISFFHC